MDNIKILRFLGDDILGEVVDVGETHVTVKNPVRIVIVPNKSDPKNPSVGFAPFMEWTNDKEFRLQMTLMICMAEPLPLFVDQYKQQFSNLIIPNTSLLTP
jgi:hypothetical protein